MRMIVWTAAAGFALAVSLSPALAAEKKGGVVNGNFATSGKIEVRKQPGKGIKGVVGTTSGTVALTAAECTTLGGTVHDDLANLCGGTGGKYCGTTDVNGVRHRVCLEAAAN